jgi:serpin B
MGASDPFDMVKANFTGISDSERIFIDKVLHKAFVEFVEEGTEATAATSISTNNRQIDLPVDVPVFKCNRPFIFLIHENKNNTILFIGKYLR